MRATRLLLCAALLGCVGPAPLRAQSPAGADLDGAEAALDAGRVEEARRDLREWLRTHGSRDLPPQARWLRARLALDVDSARQEYLRLAVDGRSDYAPRAWLRLAQLDLIRGDPASALEGLERLRADHPRSDRVGASWLWTGLALESSGMLERACRAWERAAEHAAGPGGPALADHLRAARGACGGTGMTLTVQLGAFEAEAAARRLADRAREAGFDARVDRIEALWRVRVGRFGNQGSAREEADRLREREFPAMIVAVEGDGG